jgi:PAS domain S-box-containing protein
MYINPVDDFNRLSDAMGAAGMAWWEIELPSGVVFFGNNKAAMIGRDPSEFVHYKNFTDLVHPDDHDHTMRAMTDHLEGKTDYYETKYRIMHKDGHYVTFYDRGKIVQRSADGEIKIAGIVLNVAEITATVTV